MGPSLSSAKNTDISEYFIKPRRPGGAEKVVSSMSRKGAEPFNSSNPLPRALLVLVTRKNLRFAEAPLKRFVLGDGKLCSLFDGFLSGIESRRPFLNSGGALSGSLATIASLDRTA